MANELILKKNLEVLNFWQAGLLTEKELVRLEVLQDVTENKHYVRTRNLPPSITYIYMGLGNLFFCTQSASYPFHQKI